MHKINIVHIPRTVYTNLSEAIILGQYFPNIRAKYSLYIKEQAASNLELLFKDNKTNGELWKIIFDDQLLTQDLSTIYIYIYMDYSIIIYEHNI